jgi:5-methylthioadenosine/S-adenosylhomocysteine deaminase
MIPSTSAQSTTPDTSGVKSFLIRNAYVKTMDDALGDLPQADVHVADGKIVAVRPNINADVDLIVDGTNKVVMPGIIDGHTHMWTSIWRNLDVSGLRLTDKLSPLFRPEDSHNAVALCAYEMLGSGITTVHAWEHNIRSYEHASAELHALRTAGIRTRYSYGYHHHMAPAEMMDTKGLIKARDNYASELITLGYASRIFDNGGVGPSPYPAANAEVRAREWEFAHRERLPITHHVTDVTAQPEPYYEFAGPDVSFAQLLPTMER